MNDEELKAFGFEPSSKYGGCLVKPGKLGSYVVFRPSDSRSRKYELSYNRPGVQQIFRPTSALGVMRFVLKNEKVSP